MDFTKIILYAYQLEIGQENNFSLGKNENLIPNTDNKKYKLHYKRRKLYLELELEAKLYSVK